MRKFSWIKIGKACGEPRRDVVRSKLTFPRHEQRWHYSITWCIISVFRGVNYRRPYAITINERKKFSDQLIRNWRNIERSIGIPRIYVNRKKWNKLVSNWKKHIDDYVLQQFILLWCALKTWSLVHCIHVTHTRIVIENLHLQKFVSLPISFGALRVLCVLKEKHIHSFVIDKRAFQDRSDVRKEHCQSKDKIRFDDAIVRPARFPTKKHLDDTLLHSMEPILHSTRSSIIFFFNRCLHCPLIFVISSILSFINTRLSFQLVITYL